MLIRGFLPMKLFDLSMLKMLHLYTTPPALKSFFFYLPYFFVILIVLRNFSYFWFVILMI